MKKKDSRQDVHVGSMSGGIIANQVTGGIVQSNVTHPSSQPIDYDRLALELRQLRKAMRELDTEAEHVIATAEIQKAEQAAQNKETRELETHLRQAGQWALDVATKIGVSLVSDMLKKALGIST